MKLGGRTFFVVRVSVLAGILAIVLLYAWHDVEKRHARNEWKAPLTYGLVLVRLGPVTDAASKLLFDHTAVVEERLKAEFVRRGGGFAPIRFVHYGPVDVTEPPPAAPGDGVLELLRHTWRRYLWVRDVDKRAGLDGRGLDGRVYVVARPPRGETVTVEGLSEENGKTGIALVDLDESSADFALVVATHELFHTLGASDKYGPDGLARYPEGYAEPAKRPRFPQTRTELMARGAPQSPTDETTPESIDDVIVGDTTAREIGWLR